MGDKMSHLSLAAELIQKHIGEIMEASKIYETEAWGISEQENFFNQAFLVETSLNEYQLLEECNNIEKMSGRERKEKWGPRSLDIDIIFFNDVIINSEGLTIPHPRMQDRNFVLVPISEIAPYWIHPVLNKSMEELKEKSLDTGNIITQS